jgi:hypothetical protein
MNGGFFDFIVTQKMERLPSPACRRGLLVVAWAVAIMSGDQQMPCSILSRLWPATVEVPPKTGKATLLLSASAQVEQPLVQSGLVNLLCLGQLSVDFLAEPCRYLWISDDLIGWGVETHIGLDDRLV